MNIKKIAVIGSGVMGAQIAALAAGTGLEVLLLDILPLKAPGADEASKGVTEQSSAWRDKLSLQALANLSTLKPSPLYRASDLKKIKIGNLEDDFQQLADADWIIEVVIERLDIKQSLYARLEKVIKKDAILSSNTSGLSVEKLTEKLSDDVKRRFLVTHFFNPPRYLKLLELVPGKTTDAKVVEAITQIGENVLGKGVVVAKDTPNFIANRIGVFHFLDVMHQADKHNWPVEAVDAVCGIPTARPKSAVFRTADVVGLDTLSLVAENVIKGCSDDEFLRSLSLPQYLHKMILKGLTGQKVGKGFYTKDPATKQIVVIDPATLEYRAKMKFKTPSLGKALGIDDPAKRLQTVVFADDQAAEIAWPTIRNVLLYAAARIPEIADDIVQVDRAMRWGFNWELGPFEMWDALGVERVCEKLATEKQSPPALVQSLLQSGCKSFYEWKSHKRFHFFPQTKTHVPENESEKNISLREYTSAGAVVEKNAGASLLDLGDGIFCCEFHTKMNAIDGDIIGMLDKSLARVEAEGTGLLIANQGGNFSAGANLLLVLMSAQQERWDELERTVRSFQDIVQRMRFSSKPVMSVPYALALGGGCEFALAAGRRVALAETYMGLVEMGAGVVPAGGGCKNLLLQFAAEAKRKHNPKDKIWFSADDGGPFQKVRKAFEYIGTGKVSTSAFEAKSLGFLTPDDLIVLDKDKLLYTAKQELLIWSKTYVPASEELIQLPGKSGKMALLNGLKDWKAQGLATDYDCVIAEKLAHVLSGGDKPTLHITNEQHVLDLEREAFLSLCGNKKTHERMMSLLQTGRPLRN